MTPDDLRHLLTRAQRAWATRQPEAALLADLDAALAADLGDDPEDAEGRFWVAWWSGRLRAELGEVERAQARFHEAATLALACQVPAPAALAMLSQAEHALGVDPARALALAQAAGPLAQGAAWPEAAAEALFLTGRALSLDGQPQQAIAAFQGALSLLGVAQGEPPPQDPAASEGPLPALWVIAKTLTHLAHALLDAGRARFARRRFEELLRVPHPSADPLRDPQVAWLKLRLAPPEQQAALRAQLGPLLAADPHTAALASAAPEATPDLGEGQAAVLLFLCEEALMDGATERARALYQRLEGLALAHPGLRPWTPAWALLTVEVLRAQGEVEQAKLAAARLLQVLQAPFHAPWIGRAHLALAQLCREQGDAQGAGHHLREALPASEPDEPRLFLEKLAQGFPSFEEAVRALQRPPQLPAGMMLEAWSYHVALLRALGQPEQAERSAREAAAWAQQRGLGALAARWFV